MAALTLVQLPDFGDQLVEAASGLFKGALSLEPGAKCDPEQLGRG